MQIVLNWINELIDIKSLKLTNFIKILTLGGFEIEEILKFQIKNNEQIALDISTTTNRSDSLSIQGMANEISILTKNSFKQNNYTRKNSIWKQNILGQYTYNLENKNCLKFLAIVIENVDNFTVPKWITQKLLSSGIKPLNNFEDFQNYILLETGYPFEIYDFEKICQDLNSKNFTLKVENLQTNSNFFAKNNFYYEIDNSILSVTANKTPISIAGLISNSKYQISKNTKTLLIEASIFNAGIIRQQSRKLGIRTDRSARYEKALNDTYLIESLYRLISLLRITNPNLICKFHTLKRINSNILKPIELRKKTIDQILGQISNFQTQNSYLTPKRINNYLLQLKFPFIYDNLKDIWLVKIPSNRSEDISREIDLIEEIGRLHGFNNFLTRIPLLSSIGIEDSNYKIRKKITNSFLNIGLNELIHYSLVSSKTIISNEIKIINPISSDYSNLRFSLLPNLIKATQENIQQKNKALEGFEYGHIFSVNNSKKLIEKEYVAGIFKIQNEDWYTAKSKIEKFLYQLNLKANWKRSKNNKLKNLFYSSRTAEIHLKNGKKIGIFGQINPVLSYKLNLSSHFYLFEFDIQRIENHLNSLRIPIYNFYSFYPKIVKDLSFIVRYDIKFNQIQKELYLNGTKYLLKINLLDDYQGETIPKNYRSLCLQLIFQSTSATLEKKEIETIIKRLQILLINKFKAKIRI